jgi:diadenosine tetraphosphate (Ap4A) HIT family hydrolase
MAPCYFCRIIEGAADRWSVIDESELTVTLLNGRQFEVGQCLIVPVRHAPTLLDLREEEEAAIMAAARHAARALVEAFDPDGILLYQNNGIGSGQEVPHFHLHVVPRRAGSEWGVGPPQIARLQRRPPHLDHAVVTDDKRHTAEIIRRHWERGSVAGGPHGEGTMQPVTRDAERAYVRNWVETGRLLEEVRWRELRNLDDSRALRASDDLLAAAACVPMPSHRRTWSGLVDLQDRLHGRRRR